MTTDLDRRTGLPEDLRFLLERYPREVWDGHANLGHMVSFWLQRHDMFRELGGALRNAMTEFREGKMPPHEFQAWFVPRLQFFLSQLNAHHHIEDDHYFPIFRTAEARLLPGFELLEGDHETLHAGIIQSVETANEVLRNVETGGDALSKAADSYAEVNERLLKQMLRHLDDEEDLIVPLILDRTEQKLGVG